MKEANATGRLLFLAEEFDVFECQGSDGESYETKLASLEDEGYECNVIKSGEDILCISSTKKNSKGRINKKVSVSSDVFANIISADPTENKMHILWMLTVFTRFVKLGDNENIMRATRFVTEDLPQANSYLKLFEENKKKKRFKELCLSNYSLRGITDPTNINQYKSLSQLFDAVDPFILREPSDVEKAMQKFVDAGQAIIPFKDRKFTLFIPKTVDANVIFDKFSNWCTAKIGNGMFKKYTRENRKPNGDYSDIYIIVNNKFFSGESDEMYQIHFETNQLRDRSNGANKSIYEPVLSESEGLTNFFYEELMGLAKSFKGNQDKNRYIKFLVEFGFSDSFFEIYEEDIPSIKIIDMNIPKLPNLERFSNLDQFIMMNTNLVDLHPSIGSLKNLELLVLSNNRIKNIPTEISGLKNLQFLNLTNNPIKYIPDEIAYLDKSNGGSLHRLCISEHEIGSENLKKLKKLLPKTLIN